MKTILAVDDDVHLLDMLDKALNPMGFQIVPHTRVGGAIDRVRELNPDYLLLDVMLPDGAGYQVARAVRKDTDLYRLPILFVSSLSDGPEVEYAIRQGGDAYLAKPFSLAQLLDRIKNLDIVRERVGRCDPMTGLLSMEAMEREIDHRILNEEMFCVCYFTIVNFAVFQGTRGVEESERVIAWLSRILEDTAGEVGMRESARFAHIGQDHFIALVEVDGYKKYCKALTRRFEDGVGAYYKDFEKEQGYQVTVPRQGVFEGAKLMHLHILLLRSDKHEFKSSHDILKAFRKAHETPEDQPVEAVFRFHQGQKW